MWNDRWGKAWWPGPVTGKMSDVAGMLFFPLLCQGIAERAGLCRAGDRRWLVGSAAATGVGFAAIKLDPWAADLYRVGLGLIQCLPRRLSGAACGPVAMQMDATDLWALPALVVAVWIGWGRGSVTPGG